MNEIADKAIALLIATSDHEVPGFAWSAESWRYAIASLSIKCLWQ